MLFIMFSFNSILLSFIFFIFGVYFFMLKKNIMMSWMIINVNSCNIEMIFFFDWISMVFIGTVLFISSMVFLYSKEYMNHELKKKYFIIILLLFVISMLLMVSSPNIISIILGWDGLGLISYLLIIYYQNSYSLNSGMYTLFMNRVGDCMLLMMIFLMINIGDWNLIFFNLESLFFSLLILLMSMTKSAQIPFSLWLPMAMAAPTPVSSLVHSSTLVTAGIYILIRFSYIIEFNGFNLYMMYIGMITMLLSSLNALYEYDLKKIIAFSTLSQLGLMFMMMSFSLKLYVFFHLVSHAMYKSLLFLCSGLFIHSMKGIQDIRFMGGIIHSMPLIMVMFNFSTLSLCGIFFLSGFYSKDLLYEIILNYNLNLFLYLIMNFCLMLTLIYSFRLSYFLILNKCFHITLHSNVDNMEMSLSMLFLFFMSIMFGTMFNWVFISSISLCISSIMMKLNLYFMLMMGLLVSLLNNKIEPMIKTFKQLFMISDFFFLYYVIDWMNKFPIKCSNFIYNVNEVGWNEYYSKMMFYYYMVQMKKMNNLMFMKTNYMDVFMLFIYFLLIIMILI